MHLYSITRKTANLTALTFFVLALFSASAFASEKDTREKKKWTVLIFLNADNNLERFGYGDIRELEKVGSTSDVDVVVQFDWLATKGTKRLHIEKTDLEYKSTTEIHSTVIEEMPEQDMGATKTFIDFVVWGMKNYPAENYNIIVWNHGSGWDKEEILLATRGISYDDTSGNHMRTTEFADAVDQIIATTGNRIAILAFDACLMAMAEIADSLSGMVDFLVASEETIPGDGFAYDDLLQAFERRGSNDRSARSFLKDMIKTYGDSYTTGSQGTNSVTLSALDLSKLELLKKRLNAWVDLVPAKAELTKKDFLEAARQSQYYAEDEYRDLAHYIKNVLKKITADESGHESSGEFSIQPRSEALDGVVGVSMGVLRALEEVVVENFASSRYSDSKGVSIFIPVSSGNYSSWNSSSTRRDAYLKLKWSLSTNWASHLDYLFK